MFRLALPDDFEAISKLIQNEAELFLVYPSGKFPLDITQVKELYTARKDFTVLLHNDKIIGFANLYDFLIKEYVFIGNVVIAEAHRGKGYGKTLVTHMINLARSYKLPEVRISVFSENVDALLLYSDLGFELYAMREQKNHFNEEVTLLDMKLSLKSL